MKEIPMQTTLPFDLTRLAEALLPGTRVYRIPALYELLGPCFFACEEVEGIVLDTQAPVTTDLFYAAIHEVVHLARRRQGVPFYNRPVMAHFWWEICSEEHAVNDEAIYYAREILEKQGLWTEEVARGIWQSRTESDASYDIRKPSYQWLLGLGQMGLTTENARGQIEPHYLAMLKASALDFISRAA